MMNDENKTSKYHELKGIYFCNTKEDNKKIYMAVKYTENTLHEVMVFLSRYSDWTTVTYPCTKNSRKSHLGQKLIIEHEKDPLIQLICNEWLVSDENEKLQVYTEKEFSDKFVKLN